MKKIAAQFTALILVLGLCACTATQPEGSDTEVSQGPTWQKQYDLGVRYLSEGNYEEAILAFTAAIEIDPMQAEIYVKRGDAYILSGETEENLAAALVDYEKAIELDETLSEAYLGLADVYVFWGDYDKALEILQQGLHKASNGQIIAEKISLVSEMIDEITLSAENALREKLYETLGDVNVIDFCTADYDGNGVLEAFAVVGERDEYGAYGTVYYVSDHSVETVLSNEYFWIYDAPRNLLDFGNKCFFAIGQYYATGDLTYVFGVSDGAWYEDALSLKGQGLKKIDGSNDLTIIHSTYDGVFYKNMGLNMGHTWKPYYLYWDNGFCEYGGIFITTEVFLKCKGASDIIGMIEQSGGVINDIIYRGNNIININYSVSEDELTVYHNVTLLLNGSEVIIQTNSDYGENLLEQSDYGGIYAAAYLPAAVTYPAEFPIK